MYKAMIVDDREIMRIDLKRLKLWGKVSGFEIAEEAGNGHEALIKLQQSPVDLVITDIRMPIMDGVELLEQIRTKKLATCVVLLSECSEFEYARKGLVLGAFDYLVKPVSEEGLSQLLIRAKEFITEKKHEEKKLQIYNPYADMQQIFELIKECKNAELAAELVFDKIADSEGDELKTQLVLQMLFRKASELIRERMPWFEKFIDIKFLEGKEFSELTSLQDMKNFLITSIRDVSIKMKNIYFCNKYGSVINQISIFVLENVDSEINLTVLANHLFMNKNYLSEVFRNKTGTSVLDYVSRVKMERAKKLMVDGELKNYEIADKLGYKDTEYFSKIFKKYAGMSPTEYRNSINDKANQYS
ncbi:MAG: response regulator [Bacillota bacterium]|nr:response regulator [Bacillota bacterium]